MEPERGIEKLLRAFAKKRREQAGDAVELHPAARQRLQQEIARHPAPKSSGGFNWLSAFRPRLALALCSVTICAVGGWLLVTTFSNSKSRQLASANSPNLKSFSSRHGDEATPALAPPPMAAPTVAMDRENRAGGGRAGAAASEAQPSAPPTVLAPIIPSTEKSKDAMVAKIGEDKADVISENAPAVTAPRPAAVDSFASADAPTRANAERDLQTGPTTTRGALVPGASSTLALADQKVPEVQMSRAQSAANNAGIYGVANFKNTAKPLTVAQNFSRNDSSIKEKGAAGFISAAPPVLTSFQMEQTGNALRIVDADGSVYTGAVQSARAEGPVSLGVVLSPKNKSTAAPLAKAAPPSTAQNYFFTVAGTNHNLNQNVIFSGNLVPLTNGLTSNSAAFAFGGALKMENAANAAAPSLLSNSRVFGKAVLGNGKEVEVDATPAP